MNPRLLVALAIAVILATMSAHAFANAFTQDPSHYPAAELMVILDLAGLCVIERILTARPCE